MLCWIEMADQWPIQMCPVSLLYSLCSHLHNKVATGWDIENQCHFNFQWNKTLLFLDNSHQKTMMLHCDRIQNKITITYQVTTLMCFAVWLTSRPLGFKASLPNPLPYIDKQSTVSVQKQGYLFFSQRTLAKKVVELAVLDIDFACSMQIIVSAGNVL